MSPSKTKKKMDTILELTQERVGSEVGALMGATLTMSDFSTRLISKEDFFDEPSGKLVFSEMQLSGEIEGDGCILISIKDAIRLGGTLIMLPDNELEEVITAEDYSEELEDSYGEIANIIAGAYTKTFEEMYPKSFRFIRKTQEIITPAKVDVASDKPIPNQNYYQVTVAMKLNDVEMGSLILLIPAAPFGLDDAVSDAPLENNDSSSASEQDSSAEDTTEQVGEADTPEDVQAATAKPFDVEKQKKRVDACLKECNTRMGDEVGALLGAEVEFSEHTTRMVNKEDFFFDEASGKQILAHMDVTGDQEGRCYLYVGLKDAIYIGGTLIMLPPSELEKIVAEEDFNEDSEDAYGEIANIISGVYTKVFEEQYPDKIRFIKKNLEQIVPMKVDVESDEPMPDTMYYMATSKISIGKHSMGKLQFLVPAPIFKLDQLGQETVADDAAEQSLGSVTGKKAVDNSGGSGKGRVTGTSAGTSDESEAGVGRKTGISTDTTGGTNSIGVREVGDTPGNPEFLLVSNDGESCSRISSVLNAREIAYNVLDFKASVSDYLPGDVKAIFLVMTEVDEKGLGVAIKISSACSLPLIAAGPGWTRTKVIKAVKYGVDDILLTPASDDDIIEKIDSIQAKMAA